MKIRIDSNDVIATHTNSKKITSGQFENSESNSAIANDVVANTLIRKTV